MCTLRAKPIGIMNMLDNGEKDNKVIATFTQPQPRVAVCGSNGSWIEPRDSPNEPLDTTQFQHRVSAWRNSDG